MSSIAYGVPLYEHIGLEHELTAGGLATLDAAQFHHKWRYI